MGVKSCFRAECENIMCDHYNQEHGYICCSCLSEARETLLEKGSLDLKEFMSTPKAKPSSVVFDEAGLEKIFTRGN
jgi:hypothetical protein